MPTYFRTRIGLIARTGLLVFAAATSAIAQAPESEGVARISDRGAAANVQQVGGDCATTISAGMRSQPGAPSCQTCQSCQTASPVSLKALFTKDMAATSPAIRSLTGARFIK